MRPRHLRDDTYRLVGVQCQACRTVHWLVDDTVKASLAAHAAAWACCECRVDRCGNEAPGGGLCSLHLRRQMAAEAFDGAVAS